VEAIYILALSQKNQLTQNIVIMNCEFAMGILMNQSIKTNLQCRLSNQLSRRKSNHKNQKEELPERAIKIPNKNEKYKEEEVLDATLFKENSNKLKKRSSKIGNVIGKLNFSSFGIKENINSNIDNNNL